MKPKNMLLTLDTCLEQEKTGRKTGLLVTALMNGLMFVLSLPFMDWIQLVNIPKLFAKLGITREAAGSLYSSYSIFSLLGFVKNSGKGVFGLYAMLLLILLAATWYLELLYIWKVFRNSKGDGGKGELHTYVIGKASTLLTALLVFGSYGFVLYSNNVVKMKGFSGSWILAVELILALAAYGLIKRMEAKERIRCHEHGLIKEFQKNWVLFLMLIPLCVFFLINSYLPMIGIYFAMERFVKKKVCRV